MTCSSAHVHSFASLRELLRSLAALRPLAGRAEPSEPRLCGSALVSMRQKRAFFYIYHIIYYIYDIIIL